MTIVTFFGKNEFFERLKNAKKQNGIGTNTDLAQKVAQKISQKMGIY